jgi:hypothetical protein
MVAMALADEKTKSVAHPTTDATKNDIISSSHAVATTTTGTDKEEWQTITLKCIPFTRPTNNNNSKTNERMIARSKTSMATESDVVTTHQQPSNSLYINVALMDDDDREKRCFHCILTDCPPGLNGKLGGVTPELFAKLFASPISGTKKEVVA